MMVNPEKNLSMNNCTTANSQVPPYVLFFFMCLVWCHKCTRKHGYSRDFLLQTLIQIQHRVWNVQALLKWGGGKMGICCYYSLYFFSTSKLCPFFLSLLELREALSLCCLASVASCTIQRTKLLLHVVSGLKRSNKYYSKFNTCHRKRGQSWSCLKKKNVLKRETDVSVKSDGLLQHLLYNSISWFLLLLRHNYY